MKYTRLIILSVLTITLGSFSGKDGYENPGKIEVTLKDTREQRFYIHERHIYQYGLDTLANIRFWRKMIAMSDDSGFVNLKDTRQIIDKIAVKDWDKMGEIGQARYRDSIRNEFCISDSARIVFSIGKGDFYDIPGVMPDIHRAIPIFEKNYVDPFYAQAILLIESPAKIVKSSVGAYGPFQLMKAVAIKQGLKVNKYVDERKDFEKSAYAASRLIRTICIPYTNKMLDERCISYDASDLWYRLLVLHVYHAGAGNVAKALNAMEVKDCEGSIDIIKTLWSTKAGKFGNASQNYSQVALANLIELDNIIRSSSDEINYTDISAQLRFFPPVEPAVDEEVLVVVED